MPDTNPRLETMLYLTPDFEFVTCTTVYLFLDLPPAPFLLVLPVTKVVSPLSLYVTVLTRSPFPHG